MNKLPIDDARSQADEAPDSRLPGDRSGEGCEGLFRQMEQDVLRKAGLPVKPRESAPKKR